MAGMPIGLQLVGRAWQEATLLYVSSVVEAAQHQAHALRMPQVCHSAVSAAPTDTVSLMVLPKLCCLCLGHACQQQISCFKLIDQPME